MGIYRNINAQSMLLHTNKEMYNPMINHAYKASCYKALKIDFTNMRLHQYAISHNGIQHVTTSRILTITNTCRQC